MTRPVEQRSDPFAGNGQDATEVLAALAALRADDLDPERVTAYHFESHVEGLRDLVVEASRGAYGVNGLNPLAFPSVARIENDLVAATAAWHGGDAETVGTVTSGGTESCLLAVLGAREHWRRRDPSSAVGGVRPTVVLPVTAHPAFRKGAHLFGLEVVEVPVDPVTFSPGPAAVVAALEERTALVVVSAPEYAFGTVDPVEAVAAAASARGIPCHLDMCIGGFVLPFVREAEGLPPLGIGVPGVTSLSADLHKYAFAPKGVSVLLHATDDLRRLHWFADAGWPGYPLVNNTLLSSRSAAPAAAAWAVLARLGTRGLRDLALRSRSGALALAEAVDRVPGLRVVLPPQSTLVAITDTGDPEGPDILTVVDELTALGWDLQTQPGRRGGPRTAHVTVTPGLADQVDDLERALHEAAEAARQRGRVSVDPALAGAVSAIDPAGLDDRVIDGLLAAAGLGPGGPGGPDGSGGFALPARMAPVNALLEGLPAEVVATLLIAVLAQVYRA